MNKLVKAALAAASTATFVMAPLGVSSASADVPPTHAINVCTSATFYQGYDQASGPYNPLRTLGYGDKVGHTPGSHPVYNGWAASFDFGPNDWGYMRIECIGGYGSW